MTKFILVGGYPHKALDGGRTFLEELVKGFNQPVRVLVCLFARPREDWEKAFNQDKDFYTKYLHNIKFVLTLADPDNFIEQIENSDAIYIRGGDTRLLMSVLQKTGDWVSKLKGKTVAGSSAGADLFAKYFYDLDYLEFGEGLGLLPVKTLVHFGSDYNSPNIHWEHVHKILKEYKEDLEILKLSEGGFKVINKE
jgi:peptidase E